MKTKLYICNKSGVRQGCKTSCPHGIPHELIYDPNFPKDGCNHTAECYGEPDIMVRCMPYKPTINADAK
jgi:hypothetical protein